jgi:hypothetical protein
MCRMLNLTTLAPDIVAAILDATLPQHVTVHELAISPPALWEEQRERIGAVARRCRTDRLHPSPGGVVVKSVWLANSSLTAKKSELHPSYSVR